MAIEGFEIIIEIFLHEAGEPGEDLILVVLEQTPRYVDRDLGRLEVRELGGICPASASCLIMEIKPADRDFQRRPF
jgi:hypothetical protein